MNKNNWPAPGNWPPLPDPVSEVVAEVDSSIAKLTQAAVVINIVFAVFYALFFLLAILALFEAYGLRIIPYGWIQVIDQYLYEVMFLFDFPITAIMSAWLYTVLKEQQQCNPAYPPSRPVLWTILGSIPDLGAILVCPIAMAIWSDSHLQNAQQTGPLAGRNWIVLVTILTVIGMVAFAFMQYGYRVVPRADYWPVYIASATVASTTLILRHILVIVYVRIVAGRLITQS